MDPAAGQRRGLDPRCRLLAWSDASFTTALNTARDQIIRAAGVIADSVVDIVGVIGRQLLADPLRPRHRTAPRVVKRAISTYAPHTASGRLRGPTGNTQITIKTHPGALP